MTKKPSETLAEMVVEKLIEAKLLRPERKEAMVEKIAAGNMQADDWKLEIDLANEKANRKK